MDFLGFPWISMDSWGEGGGSRIPHSPKVEGDLGGLGALIQYPVSSIRDSGYRIQNSGTQENRIQDSIQDTGLHPTPAA